MATTATRPRILIADDDFVVRGALAATFGGDFEIDEAASGEECLRRIEARPPALVVLDIEMPGMDGYAACRQIRTRHSMPVIFLSAHDTLDERLEAFASGGDDFVSKPFDGEEFRHKVSRLIDRHLQLAEIRREQESLQEFTAQLLQDIGRKDVLFSFMRQNMHCTDYEVLADSLLRATDEYAIRCHVQVRYGGGAVTQTPSGPASPLETSVFEQCASLGPEFRFGRRMILNCGDVSVIVLQLPEDASTAERLQERLSVLTESAAAIAETIHIRKESASRAEALQAASAFSSAAVEELRDKYRAQQADTHVFLQRLIDDVESQYVHLGMTERQEEVMSATVRHRAEEILKLFEANEGFEAQFAAILTSLQPRSSASGNTVWLF
ncbi:hypothetical protein B9N43_11060 [Denitratisoma sp. DHT3]|uniref:response regulator n=1 Tax=Denitratisoma sp. DHT3 TaxID=1981880 RepID=UPI001198C4ED|nr:response regulator [Denitratisoma sp. DHT3]QDX81745.1 hypothetical protein B9N43_11060 [Denitratisoma sp. DHT3]